MPGRPRQERGCVESAPAPPVTLLLLASGRELDTVHAITSVPGTEGQKTYSAIKRLMHSVCHALSTSKNKNAQRMGAQNTQ